MSFLCGLSRSERRIVFGETSGIPRDSADDSNLAP